MAKKLDTSACTSSIGFPPKQGTWDFLQQAHQEEAAAIIEGMIGPGYNTSTVYVIDGCNYSTSSGGTVANITAGALFFNGEVFLTAPFSATLESDFLVTNMVDTPYTINPVTMGPANADPVQFAGTGAPLLDVHHIRSAVFQYGASGSGTFISQTTGGTAGNTLNDFDNLVFLSNIVTTNSNTLIGTQVGGMAAAYGASDFSIAVIMSGMGYHEYGTGVELWQVYPGWFFYNNQFIYCTGGGGPVSMSGPPPMVYIGTTNGLPTAYVANGSGVATATQFPYSLRQDWATAVGITALNSSVSTLTTEVSGTGGLISEVATLTTEVASGSWTPLTTFGSGWGAGTTTYIKPQVRVDGSGRVYLRGYLLAGSSPTAALFTLPAGCYSPHFMNVVCWCYNSSSTLCIPICISIDISGDVTISNPSSSIPPAGSEIDLSGIPPFFNN